MSKAAGGEAEKKKRGRQANKAHKGASKTRPSASASKSKAPPDGNDRGGLSNASTRVGSPETATTQQDSSFRRDPSDSVAAGSAGTVSSPGNVAATNEASEAISPISVQGDPTAPSVTDRSAALLTGTSEQSLIADGCRQTSPRPRLPGFKGYESGQASNKLTAHALESISKPISPPAASHVPVQKRRIAAVACSIAIMVFMLFIVVQIVLRVTRKPPNRFCQTEGCIRHARLLTVDLNQSIDPCQNFSAYVCSSWFKRQSANYLHFSKSAMDDVRKSWFPSFHGVLRDGSRILHVGRKPFLMYSVCMDKPSQYGSDVKKFHEFQDTLRVPWPEASEKRSARALDVLMTLAFKWQLPIWLRIREPPSASVFSWRFFMDPGPLIPLMRQHHLSSRADEYARYWMSFHNYLAQGRYKPALDDVAIREIYAMESDVLNSLYAARTPAVLQPLMVPVASMGAHTPSLNSEQWLQALKQLKLNPEATSGDLVLLNDAGFFRAFGQVFAKYNNTQLMELIAWSFVQLCAPVADYHLLVVRYGTEAAANKYKPYFCERFIESLYSLLVVALYSVTRMSRQQRDFVDVGFDSLVSAAAAMANTTPWMDKASRLLAAEKFTSTRLRLWPPDQYLENDALEELYETFPSEGLSFVDFWVTASRGTATKYHSLAEADAFGYPVNYALPYHYYDGPLRTVRVAVGAAANPLYYTDGTKAMFYGGLGFLMALSLVKALDSQGLKWHPNGTFGDSFLSRDSTAAFADKDGCLKSSSADHGRAQRGDSKGATDGEDSVFPEIPALEVAYAAYRASVRDTMDDISQRLPAGLSGDQTFFMTLCYMTCSRERGVDCNKAVRNFAPFATAFGCGRGTAMNPHSKCSFFGPR